MSTVPVPTPPEQSLFDKILAMLDGILEAAGGLLPGAAFADLLLKIVQKGAAAYEAHTGQPIDPSLIKPIEPIP